MCIRDRYYDAAAFDAHLAADDTVLYEVYIVERPAVEGELSSGLTILHPGKVGDEFFMTKGHFHAILETGEVYYCLSCLLYTSDAAAERTRVNLGGRRILKKKKKFSEGRMVERYVTHRT